ncbi:MAG: DUF1992 domain-containing protein [Deltaproteobacteria bacterium]|jgi:hypothetical protein|nr:DUF1992 domain-containing protein [Deltaproteobacteria bacterium]
MTGKRHHKHQHAQPGKRYTREMARARYENLQDDKNAESVEQFENPVEIKIKQAMREGAFDNLQGKGKPLDLDKYQEIPEHLRTAYHVIRNAGYVPEEISLKKEMESIKAKIKQCPSQEEKDKLMKELAEVSQQFYFCMEYNKQLK